MIFFISLLFQGNDVLVKCGSAPTSSLPLPLDVPFPSYLACHFLEFHMWFRFSSDVVWGEPASLWFIEFHVTYEPKVLVICQGYLVALARLLFFSAELLRFLFLIVVWRSLGCRFLLLSANFVSLSIRDVRVLSFLQYCAPKSVDVVVEMWWV